MCGGNWRTVASTPSRISRMKRASSGSPITSANGWYRFGTMPCPVITWIQEFSANSSVGTW